MVKNSRKVFNEYAKNLQSRGLKDGVKPKLVRESIKRGISAISEHHPKFSRMKDYLSKHMNKEPLYKLAEKVYRKIEHREELTDEQKHDYLSRALSNYVASGSSFDARGKQAILKKSLEEKAQSGFLSGFFARRELKDEKYLDKALGAFNQIYGMIKSGNYSMPELEKPLEYLNRVNLSRAALQVLESEGIIDKSQSYRIKKEIKKGVKTAGEEAQKYLEAYSMYNPKKVAAAFLGIFGIGIILSFATKITGGAIGINESNAAGAVAGLMLLIYSMILFLRSFKN